MQRVLSFQMTRNIDESSEYVTKRLCISFLFSVGFLCLLCGFLLGRFAVERSMETQAQKTRGELAENGLQTTEHLQQVMLLELTRASFDFKRAINWQRPSLLGANMQSINGFFSNLSFVHEVTNHTFCVRAIVRGSREPDRYVMLSANEGSIIIALELAQVLDRIYSAHDWRPRRSLIFCMSLMASDLCARTLPTFIQRKVVAYIAVPGRFTEANDRVTLAGSDVMRSIAVDAINTIPDVIGNWIYLEQVFDRRLSLNIPQVIFLFNSNSANSQTHHNQSLQSRGIILAQMISQTMWRLSESIIIRWEPKYFNKTVSEILESIDSEVLESIDSSKFQDAKEKLKSTLRILLAAVNDLNAKIDATENTQILRVRMWNDLLLDLDKELLCFDENFNENLQHSQPIIFRLFKSTSNILNYLNEMAKCYENAIQVLQER
ncbi:aminopeptidase NAALADL1-like [Cataglyphis hispanica]|uniref:aminopeptidase NAALADL1-like n=1 Tax=Cataglyphis hispanica TaxID=1086592 RepID=UPI00218004E7|nr:aminopeptidase NAALADL1-like [Cataglyphis hispanica]